MFGEACGSWYVLERFCCCSANEGLGLIKLVFPKEGGIGWVDNFAISSGVHRRSGSQDDRLPTSPRNRRANISVTQATQRQLKRLTRKFKHSPALFPASREDLTVWNGVAVGDKTKKHQRLPTKLKAGQKASSLSNCCGQQRLIWQLVYLTSLVR